MEKEGEKDNPKGFLGGDGPFFHPSLPRRDHLLVPVQALPGFSRRRGTSRCGKVLEPWAGIPSRTQMSDSKTRARGVPFIASRKVLVRSSCPVFPV